MIINEITPLLMFVLLFVLLIAGVPVAFSLMFTAVLFAVLIRGWSALDLVFQAFWATMNNFTLVAVPLFVFMSVLLEKSGVVEDMYKALKSIIGGIRGSLLIIALLMGYVIGAMSGIAAAGVVSIALVVYPILKKTYPRAEDMSIAITVFAGTLPQLIPPSLNMIVYSSMTGVSAVKLFAAGLTMGTMLTVIATIYIITYSIVNKDRIPKYSPEGHRENRVAYLKGLFPPIAIIASVLGSIFIGMATPTEAAGVGALAILLYTFLTGRLDKKVLRESFLSTIKLSAMVGWIISGAVAFSSVFSISGGYSVISRILLQVPRADVFAPLVLIILVIFLGMFLETTSIATILGPLSDYIIRSLGLDPLWWGSVFCFALMTAFLTPPVGMGVYLFKGVVPDIPMSRIFKAVIPFLIIELALTFIFLLYPSIILIPVRILTR
ncbi:MAG: TRAP transporter large permease subunit [Desulfurococcaceae archaeon]